MKIYTRTGDTGDTALFGGGRVAKSHPRVTAYGDVDELNSAVGFVRAAAPQDSCDSLFESIQQDLFSIGGHLATPDPDKVRKALEKAQLSSGRVAEFEAAIDDADRELPALKAFVLPAGCEKAVRRLHLRARRSAGAPNGASWHSRATKMCRRTFSSTSIASQISSLHWHGWQIIAPALETSPGSAAPRATCDRHVRGDRAKRRARRPRGTHQ